jgi:hypothetical protein|tara:strand:+ start:1172 stop:1507 length:336 start_codon:yes stop_codon:yes gene_type:complete
MANINKFKANEAVNIEAAAEWNVQTRLTISSQAHVYSNVTGVHQIGVYSDSDVKFRFDNSTSDTISANNDLVLPSQTLTFVKIPQGVGGTMYVHFKQVSSASSKYLCLVHM